MPTFERGGSPKTGFSIFTGRSMGRHACLGTPRGAKTVLAAGDEMRQRLNPKPEPALPEGAKPEHERASNIIAA
jgi:hypothetical protein